MTAACGGGTSSPIAGFANTLIVASGFAIQLLEQSGYAWLALAAPFIPLATYNLPSYCASDPPAQPTFTLAETTALLNVQFGADFNSGVTKLGALIANKLWSVACQCDSQQLPTTTAPQTPPAGTPTPVYSATPVCTVEINSSDAVAGAPNTYANQAIWDWVNFVRLDTGANFAGVPYGVRLRADNGVFGGIPSTYTWRVSSYTTPGGGGTVTVLGTLTVASGAQGTAEFVVPATSVGVQIETSYATAGTINNPLSHVALLCNPPTTLTPLPCCPPDRTVTALLNQLLSQVNILQRQLVPFAYIAGTSHPGLTGAGSFAVTGLLGLRIDLTVLPLSFSQDASVPPYIFNAGWVSIQDANGFIDETRVHSQHQVWLSRISSDATLVGYSLPPGYTATITELHREP